MKNDTTFGRLYVFIPPHKSRKIQNGIVMPQYYLTAYLPAFLSGLSSALCYESDRQYYELYNPLVLKFELDVLVKRIITIHRYSYTEMVGNFRVVRFEDR